MIRRLLPEIHPKGWGSELWITNNEHYCGKLLRFDAGKRCSLHFHKDKHETWYVLTGRIELIQSDHDPAMLLSPGDIIDVPAGCAHRLSAVTDAVIIEVSTPHDEADSIRLAPGDSQIGDNDGTAV